MLMYCYSINMCKTNKNRCKKGFSLIEMAMVMTISGLMLAGITTSYMNYMKHRRVRVTNDRLQKFDAAVRDFYDTQGRYPCPADPTTPEDGTEKCGVDAFKVIGGIDTEYLGTDTGEGDPIYVGAIPYETLRIGVEDANPDDGIMEADAENYKASHELMNRLDTLDDWGRFFTYMVPEALTTKATFAAKHASLKVVTELWVDDATTPDEVLTDPAAAWIAFSHGNNGAGGYIADGGALSPVPCTGKEAANCAALLVDPASLKDEQATIVSGLTNMVDGVNYFEDIVYFMSIKSIGAWNPARSDPFNTNSFSVRDITNNNAGFVGIGESAPSQKLDVKGVDGATGAEATSVRAARVCTSDGKNCFDTANFATGSECPVGQAMTGIYDSGSGIVEIQCAVAPIATDVPVAYPSGCVVEGEYALGINSGGGIICGVP